MAAVIGASRQLELRWRELQPEQREAFLTLISDETSRLAALIGDVLDTSRIDEGTFTYRFTDVDLVSLVTDSVATAVVARTRCRSSRMSRCRCPRSAAIRSGSDRCSGT